MEDGISVADKEDYALMSTETGLTSESLSEKGRER
jgi:hypothetical protein